MSQGVSFSSTGGTLSGSGTITPAVNVTAGNTLSPGNSIGTLSFGAGLTIGGTYAAQLGTPNASPASGLSDRGAVTGALTLTGGTLTLSDNAGANGQGSAAAGAYRLLTFTGARTGSFASVTNPLSATLHELVVYNGTSNGTVDLSLYRFGAANTITTPMNFSNFHVGDSVTPQALTITNSASNDSFSVTGSGNEVTVTSAITAAGASSALVKEGAGALRLDGAQGYDILTANAGTTNVNGILGTAPGLAVVPEPGTLGVLNRRRRQA